MDVAGRCSKAVYGAVATKVATPAVGGTQETWRDGVLRIDKSSNKLVRLTDSALSQADHWERDLQEMIRASPDEFSAEIDESLWMIGSEVRPSQSVPDRIDLLAERPSSSN
jgi:hypothetical protein